MKKVIFLVLFLCFSLTLPSLATEDINFQQGKKYFSQGENQKALECFNKTLIKEPKNFYAYYFQGLIKTRLKDYSGALDSYNQAISLNARYASPYVGRGVIYYKEKDYAKALTDLNTAISLQSNDPNIYNKRGLVYAVLGEKEKAQADFNQARVLLNRQSQQKHKGKRVIFQACPEWIEETVDYPLVKREDGKNVLDQALKQARNQALERVAQCFENSSLSKIQVMAAGDNLLKLEKVKEQKIVLKGKDKFFQLNAIFTIDAYEMQKRVVEMQINGEYSGENRKDGWIIYRRQF